MRRTPLKRRSWLKRGAAPAKKSKREIPILKNRLRTSLHSQVRKEFPICFTCGRPTQNAGHFKEAGRFKSVEFDPDNLRGQCVYCNLRLHGNLAIYADNLREDLGVRKYKALLERAHKGYIDYYPNLLKEMIDASSRGYGYYCKWYKARIIRQILTYS